MDNRNQAELVNIAADRPQKIQLAMVCISRGYCLSFFIKPAVLDLFLAPLSKNEQLCFVGKTNKKKILKNIVHVF